MQLRSTPYLAGGGERENLPSLLGLGLAQQHKLKLLTPIRVGSTGKTSAYPVLRDQNKK